MIIWFRLPKHQKSSTVKLKLEPDRLFQGSTAAVSSQHSSNTPQRH